MTKSVPLEPLVRDAPSQTRRSGLRRASRAHVRHPVEDRGERAGVPAEDGFASGRYFEQVCARSIVTARRLDGGDADALPTPAPQTALVSFACATSSSRPSRAIRCGLCLPSADAENTFAAISSASTTAS
jgi:hypothetical protein